MTTRVKEDAQEIAIDESEHDEDVLAIDGLDGEISVTAEAQRMERIAENRLRWRPDISHLEDAVVANGDGTYTWLVQPGSCVTIERVVTLTKREPKPWLDTKTYIVVAVHASGRLELIDEAMGYAALSNYITGLAYGFKFKITPKKGLSLKRKRPAKARSPSKETKKSECVNSRAKRVYNTKGKIHAVDMGMKYVAAEDTRAKSGDRIHLSVSGAAATASALDGSWSEEWRQWERY